MTFIGEFYRYLKTRTDAPPDFHVHAAIATLAYTMGTNVWCVDGWGRRPIYPNMWIAIIAHSGMGKSVPLDMCQAMLEKAGISDGILPESFSQEALFVHMESHPTGIFISQEFSAFMGAIQREYNVGTESFLTKIFDVPPEERRITMKKDNPLVILRKPCINILAASSPEWFSESFKTTSLSGGFLARFMFCPSNEPGEYVGLPGPPNDALEASLAGHLREVVKLGGKMDFTQVQDKFTEWDKSKRRTLREDYSAEFGGMRSRASLMVLKATMIFHASADPETMTVTPHDLDQAIGYVERTHAMAEAYLSNEVAGDRWEGHRIKLLEIVRGAGGHIDWSAALRKSRLSARDFRTAIDTLIDSNRLIIEPGVGKQKYLRLPEQPRPLRALA